MKEKLILFALVITLLFGIFGVGVKSFSVDDYAIGKQKIVRYIGFKGPNLKEGTPEYFDFLNNLLWGEYNQDFEISPNFRKILKYAAYYDCVDHSLQSIIYTNTIDHFFLLHFH